MVTRAAWTATALAAAVGVQRLWEVRKSARHERAILGREHAPEQMPWMRLLHGAWLAAAPLEVLLFKRRASPGVTAAALGCFAVGQGLRFAAMHALGDRWTVRIMTLPGAPAVDEGIFRYLRHPNYVGVVLEMAALPMMHGAWITAGVFSAANALLLRARISAEEAALREDSGYETLDRTPRFVPGFAA
jgi:methyltransferase